jgi:lysophospholipase L1-like esterase
MSPVSRVVLPVLATALVLVVVYDALRITRALRISSETAAASQAFQAKPEQPRARLLVIGDSTAVGTGAQRPGDSVAGRIGRAFPETRIENRARVGARIADLQAQLDAADDTLYDALLIQVGGNDILRFTTLSRVESELDGVLARAMRLSQHVAVIPPGDIGAAPAIPWPISSLYSYRSSQVRQRIAVIAGLRDVAFVDLTASASAQSPFERSPDENYSDDGLHPSGRGYGHWYAALADEVPLGLWLERRSVDPEEAHHG